jgi:hypothetical protein
MKFVFNNSTLKLQRVLYYNNNNLRKYVERKEINKNYTNEARQGYSNVGRASTCVCEEFHCNADMPRAVQRTPTVAHLAGLWRNISPTY